MVAINVTGDGNPMKDHDRHAHAYIQNQHTYVEIKKNVMKLRFDNQMACFSPLPVIDPGQAVSLDPNIITQVIMV